MATTDQSNNIDLVVSERGVSQAAEKVIILANAADKAEATVSNFKVTLQSFSAGGLTALVTALNQTSVGTQALKSQTDSLTASQKASVESSAASTRAMSAEGAAAASLKAQKQAMVAAERAASEDRKRYAAEMLAQQRSAAIAEEQAAAASKAAAEARVASGAEIIESNNAVLAQYGEMSEASVAQVEISFAQTDATNILRAAYNQLAEAQANLTELKAGYAEVQNAITEGWFSEADATKLSAVALQNNLEATEQVALAKANLVEVQGYLNAQTVVAVDTEAMETAATERLLLAERERLGIEAELNATTRGGVSANVAGAASLGLLEGRTMSMTRAASNFLTKILPLGPLLEVAFPVIGAIALIAVLGMGVKAFENLINTAEKAPESIAEAWEKMNETVRESNSSLQGTIDKLTQVNDKLEHKYDKRVGALIVIDDLIKAAQDYGKELDSDLQKFQALAKAKENKIGIVGGTLTGQQETKPVADEIGGVLAEISRKQAQTDRELEGFRSLLGKADRTPDPKHLNPISFDSLTHDIQKINDANKKDINDFINIKSSQFQGEMANYSLYSYDTSAVQNLYKGGIEQLTERQENTSLQGDLVTQQTRNQKDRGDKINGDAAAKAAREQWKQASEAFKQYNDSIVEAGLRDGTNKKPTAQQDQAWWMQERPKLTLGDNKQLGRDQEDKYGKEIEGQQAWANNQVETLREAVAAQALYGKELREVTADEKFLAEARAKGIDENSIQVQIKQMHDLNVQKQAGAAYDRALHEDAKNAKTDLDAYNTAMAAQQEVVKKHPELAAAAESAMVGLTDSYKKATEPLYEFEIAQRNATEQLKYFGQAQITESEVQKLVANNLKNHIVMSKEDQQTARDEINTLSDQIKLHKDLADIYGDEAQKLADLKIAQEALDIAHKKGRINPTEYQSESVQNMNQQNMLKDATGQGKASDLVTVPLAKYASQFESFASSVQTIFTNLFDQLGKGIGDVFSKWIVYGGDVKQAMKSLAQEILSSLLSAIIQVVIQATIMKVLMMAMGLASGGAVGADGSAIGGSSTSAFANGGLIRKFALGGAVMAASMIPGYAQGGHIQRYDWGGAVSGAGTGRSDSILAMLSNGEYVMDAQSTKAIGIDALDAMRNGVKSVGANSPGMSGAMPAFGGRSPKMVIEDHTAGVKWQTIQVGHDEMRVIARDESKKAVYAHTDDATGQNMTNPNSKTRKSLHQNTDTRSLR